MFYLFPQTVVSFSNITVSCYCYYHFSEFLIAEKIVVDKRQTRLVLLLNCFSTYKLKYEKVMYFRLS